MPDYTVKSDMILIDLSSLTHFVKKGTYSKKEVCIYPISGKFSETVSFTITSSDIFMVPEYFIANLGDE